MKRSILFLILLFISTQVYQSLIYASQIAAYRVGPSDVLEISVWGEPDLNKTIAISPEGTINFPLLRNILVSGMTIKEIEKNITYLLERDYLVNPQVSVSIKEYNSQKVIVLGEIKTPGIYVLTGETTLLEILSKAGGVIEKESNNILIFRDGQDIPSDADLAKIKEETMNRNDPIIIKADRLLKKTSLSDNILVQSGDIVFIEGKKDTDINTQKVYITGNVNKPGVYDYQNGLTALTLCILAGGFTDIAAPNRATIFRNLNGESKIYRIDLNKVKKGKSPDFKLMAGDRINIPEAFW